jgi:hypothetical protein
MLHENTKLQSAASTASSIDVPLEAAPARKSQEVCDRDLAQAVTAAMHAMQDAMDKAILGGLIVEPSFQAVENWFSNVGVSAESYHAKCNIYRRLS